MEVLAMLDRYCAAVGCRYVQDVEARGRLHRLARPALAWLTVLFALALPIGCTSYFVVPEDTDTSAALAEPASEPPEDGLNLIRDFVSPWNTNYLKVEGVALVTGLNGTGSDPAPSPYRTMLIDEMQTHEVKTPNKVLASADTAMVIVRGYLPPGVQKGDRFDVQVRVPPQSETKSLRGGWLMRSRLREMAVLNNAVRTGRVDALAQGQVLISSVFEGDAEVDRTRGHVLSGGVALMSRPLGLSVRSDKHSVRTSSMIGAAINSRFHTYDQGVKKGVATPKRDSFIELQVHPRYKHNIERYIRVIQSIALRESPADRVQRVELLEKKLLEPTTCLTAALQLEAIGKEAIPVLRRAITSEDPEVRFYAAEALAYMDESDAAATLAAAARDEPAFRWHAIAGLAVMEGASAYDELVGLFDSSSAETRYAAFRALRMKNHSDPLVRGEILGEKFSYHLIHSSGPPMIHFSRSRRAELVVFGHDQRMQPPAFLYAGKNIMLKGVGGDRIKVTRFSADGDDQVETCSTLLDDVIRTIVKLDGDYGDVLQALQDAKGKNYLDARLVVDALPRPGRVYRRGDEAVGTGVSQADDEANSLDRVRSPLPDMFNNLLWRDDQESPSKADMQWDIDAEEEERPNAFVRFGKWFIGAQ